jgi:NUMOD3 motif
MFIYRLTVGNRQYFGKTCNPITRKHDHQSLLNRGKHYNLILQRSFNKHGKMDFCIMEEVDDDIVDEVEIRYIAENDCCNIMKGGEGRSKGYSVTEETRERISAASKGRPSPRKGKKIPPTDKWYEAQRARYAKRAEEKYQKWLAVKR